MIVDSGLDLGNVKDFLRSLVEFLDFFDLLLLDQLAICVPVLCFEGGLAF